MEKVFYFKVFSDILDCVSGCGKCDFSPFFTSGKKSGEKFNIFSTKIKMWKNVENFITGA